MILNYRAKGFTHPTLFLFIHALLLLSSMVALQSAHAKHLLVYGDSLSAAYGMEEQQGWVHLLSQSLAGKHTISNASISGETTGGGLARLPVTLDELTPDIVMLELGANDGLRGYSPQLIEDNLRAMVRATQASGATVFLASISLPPTYGPRYIDQFRSVYSNLSEELGIPLLDLYRPEFVTTAGYIQEDGLHPSALTQPIVKDMVLDFLNDNNLLE